MAQTTEVIRSLLTPEERAAFDRNFERHKLLVLTNKQDPMRANLEAAVQDLGDVFESLAAVRMTRPAAAATASSITRWRPGVKYKRKA